MTKWRWVAAAVCLIAAAIYISQHLDYGTNRAHTAARAGCIRWEMEKYARKELIMPDVW
jgi:hypothetical protein